MRLFATKVVLKQAATNVSQNLYNRLDFLSHFKSGIINRGGLNAAFFSQYNVLFY